MRKKDNKNKIKKNDFSYPVIEKSIEPPVIQLPAITLNEYLSKYNRKRVLDNIITKWYFKKDPMKPKKTVAEWDEIIELFNNETEI